MGWRFHLQTLPGRVWIDRNVPLQNARVTEAVCGPGDITGVLPLDYEYRSYLLEWGALLVAEKDGSDPVSCIVDSVTTEGLRLNVGAGGFSMYPKGMPWTDADYSGIQVDPLGLVRQIWNRLQEKPSGDLGVVLDSTTTPVRLGTPENPQLTAAKAALHAANQAEAAARVTYTAAAQSQTTAKVSLLAAAGRPSSGVVLYQDSAPSGSHRSARNLWLDKNDGNKPHVWNGKAWTLSGASQATINSRLNTWASAGTSVANAKTAWASRKKDVTAAKKRVTDINGGEAVPYTFTWWGTRDLGGEIDELAKNTPFDYRERSAWSGEDITHRLELGYPTLGGRRTDLRFEVGVNVTVPPPLQERDYASEVMVLGAGEGRAMVRATATGNGGRVRRAVVVDRKDLRATVAAAAAARAEVAKRAAVWTFESLDVTDHPHAPYGSFRPGDIIYVTGNTGWKQLDDWVRILSVATDCTTGKINLRVEPT